MAEITVDESWRQIRALIGRAEQAADERRWTDAVAAWRTVLAHPCAHHQVVAYEVLEEIHQAWRQAGRYDDAIVAKREAIAAGYRSVPDAEADIAECLLAAGRREQADALFASLRERDSDDVWLYNAAAYSYADVDVRASLEWALDGIEVALATGDPDQVVMQLLECAEASWKSLAEPVDEDLVEKVERFCENWTRPATTHDRFVDAPSFEDRPCAYCGYRPETSRAEHDERARRARRRLLEAENREALARLDAAEARIKRITRQVPGHRLHIAAVTVAGLVAHAEEFGYDPGTGEARSSYAAALLEGGQAIVWPPGRNEPCWCGSNRKYKKCCGPVPAADDDSA